MKRIYDYDLKDLEEYVVSKGYKKYKAKQIYHWLYKKRVSSFDEMTDLSKDFITELKDEFIIENLTLVTSQVSKDGTTKYLFSLTDGSLIESVLMVFDYGYSACITTQIGCNMGCTFCASGLLKKVRDLSAGEILNQIVYIQKELDKKGESAKKIELPITGIDIMKHLSIKPSATVGALINKVKHAWIENPKLTKEEALKIVKDEFQKMSNH